MTNRSRGKGFRNDDARIKLGGILLARKSVKPGICRAIHISTTLRTVRCVSVNCNKIRDVRNIRKEHCFNANTKWKKILRTNFSFDTTNKLTKKNHVSRKFISKENQKMTIDR